MATKPEIERLAVLETKMSNVESTVNRIELKIDGFDNKYASKLSERVVYGLIVVIVLFVINSWLGLLKLPVTPAVVNPTSTTSSTTSTVSPPTNSATSQTPDNTSSNGALNVTLPKVLN